MLRLDLGACGCVLSRVFSICAYMPENREHLAGCLGHMDPQGQILQVLQSTSARFRRETFGFSLENSKIDDS
ncbi:hypothetical protein VWY02_13125 [Phaeobacter sp. JH18-17]|uniref:hypothetical protein n=1 Tax=unclassified Phaeobacter TaxID=2621772 RepID=UPI003A86042C